jgi:hypothetical protein
LSPRRGQIRNSHSMASSMAMVEVEKWDGAIANERMAPLSASAEWAEGASHVDR